MDADYLGNYLQKIENDGNIELAESIRKTTESFNEKYLANYSFASHEVGLLFGNVQSGKTGQMFGIMCQAAMNGFYAFLLLTTDNTVLQQQTLNRVKRDLTDFLVCDETDSGLFIDNQLQKPVVVVLKKNYRVLRLWANVFNTTQFMQGNALFVVDDEADAASLNTMVNKDKQSSINRYISSIKDGGMCSIYLQVTGTPQSLLLQTEESGFKPSFTHFFEPGKTYLGGNFFFPATGKPECVTYLTDTKKMTRQVVLRHLTTSAQLLCTGSTVSNCLVHPSVRQNVHEKFAKEIRDSIDWCISNIDGDFEDELHEAYEQLTPSRSELQDFEAISSCCRKLLLGNEIKVLIMNGKYDVTEDDYKRGCNFIIGGNTLGRGVTFPCLQTIYYTRLAKKPQADTMWQHSRMFGYDRDPGLMMVYIPQELYKWFSDINATNNSIIAQLRKGVQPRIYYPEGLKPTRSVVLDDKHVGMLSGGTNYYPSDPDNSTIEEITKLLAGFQDNEPYYTVSLKLIENVLGHIVPSPEFKLTAFMSILRMMLAQNPGEQGILVVRRNRNVAQWTGALLSPNDWQTSNSFPKRVVLTMYQVTGTKGWHGKKLWVSNIKLPNGNVYYDEE
ncbi:restriction endonuclease [Bifidobacterium dentium]|uniref:Z1 domain-containing protein n=1 Tax=Bifidobacterium dentium TaxID=1689 RepID=UPI0018B01A8E|nr:Z1 domain-containing protein [Bifidobacterium dentium]MBF9668185.1 restriction endonuclease [Bifidobacterium dentium]